MIKISSIIAFLLAGLILIGLIEQFLPIFALADEIILILILAIASYFLRIPKEIFYIFATIFIFIIYSICQSYFSPYYRGITLTILDSLLFFKSLFYFILFASIPSNMASGILSKLKTLAYSLITLFLIVYLLNLFLSFLDPFEYRFGIPSYSAFFSNPGEFATITFLMHVILIISTSFNPLSFFSFTAFFLQLSSLRYKAFVLSAFSFFLILLLRKENEYTSDYSKILKKRFLLASPLIFLIMFMLGFNQFAYYYAGSEVTPRLLLLTSSFSVASDFFPFGAGGGTFGSAVANSNYSPLYYDLNFDGKYGLSSYDTGANYLSDQFWPMILAQYGWTGVILYLYILWLVFITIKKNMVTNRQYLIGFYMIVVSLILSSLGSAIFTGYLGCVFLSMLGLMYASRR